MPVKKRSPQLQGIQVRHARDCRSREGGACSCRPSYRGKATRGRSTRLYGPWTRSLAEARSWRTQKLAQLAAGDLATETRSTVAELADTWVEGAKAGSIRTRSGHVYKPSAVRRVEVALDVYVRPVLGHERLNAVTRARLQRWVGTLIGDGLSASTIRNTLGAVRVLYRHALEVGETARNPTSGLRLPALEKHTPRIVPPDEAAKLIAALPGDDAVIWATAFYAGLRRGELWGLRVADVDVGEGILRVRHNEDVIEGRVDPKSAAGFRPVPIIDRLAALLRPYLDGLSARYGRKLRGDDRVFPGERAARFSDSALVKRSVKKWEAAKLAPVGLHDCRHTFAAFGIAAGWNAKTLQTYMGHSSITVTFDVYGHLFPGSEDEARRLLDAYLDR